MIAAHIRRIAGKDFQSIPVDGKLRKFMAGEQEWFAISFGTESCFGCWDSGDLYIVIGADMTKARLYSANSCYEIFDMSVSFIADALERESE